MLDSISLNRKIFFFFFNFFFFFWEPLSCCRNLGLCLQNLFTYCLWTWLKKLQRIYFTGLQKCLTIARFQFQWWLNSPCCSEWGRDRGPLASPSPPALLPQTMKCRRQHGALADKGAGAIGWHRPPQYGNWSASHQTSILTGGRAGNLWKQVWFELWRDSIGWEVDGASLTEYTLNAGMKGLN